MDIVKALNCAVLMSGTGLTPDEAITAAAAWEQIMQILPELSKLNKLAREAGLSDEDYNDLRGLILNGALFEDAANTLSAGMSVFSATEPEEPVIDLSYVAPYSLQSGQGESVSLSSGSLSLTYPLVSLPGVNGFGAGLSLNYDSSSADIYDMGTSAFGDYRYYFYKGYYAYYDYPPIRLPQYDITPTQDGPYISYISAYNARQEYLAVGLTFTFPEYYEDTKYCSKHERFSRTMVQTAPTPNGPWTDGPWVPSEAAVPRPATLPHTHNYGGVTYSGDLSSDPPAGYDYGAAYPVGNIYNRVRTGYMDYSGNVTAILSRDVGGVRVPLDVRYSDGSAIKESLQGYYYEATIASKSFQNKPEDIGAGWSWNLPVYNTSGNVIKLAGGSAYELNNNLTFKDYTLDDMLFSTASGFTSGGQSAAYKLEYKSGLTYWFNSHGICIGKSDRFGNSIYYHYTTGPNGYRLSKIVDTAGREILLTYADSGSDTVITLISPDGEETAISLSTYSGRKILNSIENPAEETTGFTYSYDNAYFYLSGYGGANNKAANLVNVLHPTGAETKYTYTGVSEGIGYGNYQTAYKLTSRKDVADQAEYNRSAYAYAGTYTGYPSYYRQEDIPGTYTYTTTVTNGDGVVTVNTFNNKSLNIGSSTSFDNETIQTVTTGYNSDKLPISTTTRIYNGSGDYMETISLAEYDSHGNVTASWSPLAEGLTTNTEHKTVYDYGNSANNPYWFVLGKTYKQGEYTEVYEESILTYDQMNIAAVNVYENSVLRSSTEYEYYQDGQLGAASAYNDYEDEWVDTGYNYDMYGNLTMMWVSDVRDADGDYVNGTGVIGTTYTYDIMGRVLSSTDAAGNVTEYAYDDVGGVQTVTNPDNSTVEYDRDYAANTLTVTDERGYKTRYEYDALGNEKRVVTLDSYGAVYEILGEKEYDEMSRVAAEYMYSGATNYAKALYTYDIMGRVLSKTVIDQDSVLLAQELYEYENAVENGLYNKVTKTVAGETDAPDIVTTSYTDKVRSCCQAGALLRRRGACGHVHL